MDRQRGFSIIELLIVVAILMVLAAIAIPSMIRAKIAANEAAAVANIRTITSAQISYKIFYPNVGYAAKIADLGPSGNGLPSPTAACLLNQTLGAAPFQANGYTYSSLGDDSHFEVYANPSTPGQTGIRSFCTDTPGVIYYSPTANTCKTGVNVL